MNCNLPSLITLDIFILQSLQDSLLSFCLLFRRLVCYLAQGWVPGPDIFILEPHSPPDAILPDWKREFWSSSMEKGGFLLALEYFFPLHVPKPGETIAMLGDDVFECLFPFRSRSPIFRPIVLRWLATERTLEETTHNPQRSRSSRFRLALRLQT